MTNIALVVLDTLRKDAFERYFDWVPGRRFENAYSTANWTSPAHASMFTGQYPSEVGVHAKSPSIDVDIDVLPELLSSAGYRTRCWTANPNISPQREWDRGFDEFVGASKLMSGSDDVVDWSTFAPSESSVLGRFGKYPEALSACFRAEYDTWESLRTGISYFRGGVEELDRIPDDGASSIPDRLAETEFGDDEFLFLNLMEAHTPYYTPSGFEGPDREDAVTVTIKHSLGLESPPDSTRGAYFDASQYLSTVYRDIFGELSSEFDYVVTVSDHGEMLGESDTWNHTYGLFPQITHVPLVISGDGLGGEIDKTVSLLDLHRTVSDLADLETQSRGRNLLDVSEGESVLTEYHGLIPVAVRRLEEENVSPEILEEYDSRLSGVAIPPSYYGYETNDGYTGEGTAADDPDETMERLRESVSERNVETDDGEMSEEVIDRLDDLGYV
jgi:arylsulfatase